MIFEYAPVFLKKKEKLLTFGFLGLGAVLFATSMIPSFPVPWVLQLLSAAAFVAMVMIFSMILSRRYVYSVEAGAREEPDFVITEYYSCRKTVVCRVALSSVLSVTPWERGLLKGKGKASSYVYTAVLFDEARYLLEVEEGGERFFVCICACEELLAFFGNTEK